MSAAGSPRAQGASAHARPEWDYESDPAPEFLAQLLNRWRELEDQLAKVQEDKKLLIAAIRNRHGRHVAEAVKLSMQLMMLDPSKRFERQKFSEMARRYVAAMEDAELAEAAHG